VDNQNEKKEQHPVAKPRTVGIVRYIYWPYIKKESQPTSKVFFQQRSYRARDEHPLVKTTVIDLETEVLPEANNLQEALRRRRPGKILKSKSILLT